MSKPSTGSPEAVEVGDPSDVLVDVRNGVATITLNRPDRLNAMTSGMLKRYLAAVQDAGDHPSVRVVVVTGAGRAFCAGADFEDLEGLDGAELAHRRANRELPLDIAMSIPKPVIAAINGPVAGIGMAHALMADLRFASNSAKFVTAFSKFGLVAEGGLSWLLPRLVGTARALDLLWSSRPCSSEEALRVGLVQWVVPDDELRGVVEEYARNLAENASPHSLSTMKQQVYADWSVSWDQALTRSNQLVAESMDRPEFAARIRARRGRGGD